MLRTFLNMFITQETPLLSEWCFYTKMLSCFFNFLQTTSAAYGYYPYLFPFLLSSIHHMYPYLMIIGCTDIGISRKSIRTALRSV